MALRAIAQELRKCGAANINIEVAFSSEDPFALHCHRFLQQNVKPNILYADMHQRVGGVGPTVFVGAGIPVDEPGFAAMPPKRALHLYMVGFECQDLSWANHRRQHTLNLRPALLSEPDDPNHGRSQRTLLSSCRTVLQLDPVVALMENVGGCPSEPLLAFLCQTMPEREWGLFKLEAADFGGIPRFRVLYVGVRRHRLRLPFSQWIPYLEECVVPRHEFPCAAHILADTAPEVMAEQAHLRRTLLMTLLFLWRFTSHSTLRPPTTNLVIHNAVLCGRPPPLTTRLDW